jgi:phosphinothricin acetyltransferase
MIIIRDAVEADLPQILEIYNEVIINTTAVFSYEPHTLQMREQWFTERRQQGFPIVVADEDGVIVGFAALGWFRAWPAYKHTCENSLYVKTGNRGKGIGKLLLKALIDEAKQINMHVIIAGIEALNEGSIALHKQFGFEEAALLKEVGYKFDAWLDLLFMQLIVA